MGLLKKICKESTEGFRFNLNSENKHKTTRRQ
jgi:hypothetical protein